MAEYISKDEAMDAKTMCDLYINNAGSESPVWTDGHIVELLEDFIVIPKEAPVANVKEIKRGTWEELETEAYSGKIDKDGNFIFVTKKHFRCTNCGNGSIYKSDYCPRCGAKMK